MPHVRLAVQFDFSIVFEQPEIMPHVRLAVQFDFSLDSDVKLPTDLGRRVLVHHGANPSVV